MWPIHLGEEDFVYDYPFTSQRECHFASDLDFLAIPSLICPICSYREWSYQN